MGVVETRRCRLPLPFAFLRSRSQRLLSPRPPRAPRSTRATRHRPRASVGARLRRPSLIALGAAAAAAPTVATAHYLLLLPPTQALCRPLCPPIPPAAPLSCRASRTIQIASLTAMLRTARNTATKVASVEPARFAGAHRSLPTTRSRSSARTGARPSRRILTAWRANVVAAASAGRKTARQPLPRLISPRPRAAPMRRLACGTRTTPSARGSATPARRRSTASSVSVGRAPCALARAPLRATVPRLPASPGAMSSSGPVTVHIASAPDVGSASRARRASRPRPTTPSLSGARTSA